MALAAGAVVTLAPTASAADACRHWCHNVVGALDDQDWVGGPHPTRRLMTVADNGQLGFMKDTDIYSETDPVRDC